MRPLSETEILILERFERLPDTAAVSLKIAATLTGTSDRSWRRNPPIQVFRLTPGKRGVNVGQLRKLVRGELAAPAA